MQKLNKTNLNNKSFNKLKTKYTQLKTNIIN